MFKNTILEAIASAIACIVGGGVVVGVDVGKCQLRAAYIRLHHGRRTIKRPCWFHAPIRILRWINRLEQSQAILFTSINYFKGILTLSLEE
jgi:hypothetical protein